MTTPSQSRANIVALSAARWRVAIPLTVAMMVLYFGFILLVAFNKPLLAFEVTGGLSVGMVLGVVVILSAWFLIYVYVQWANSRYDARVAQLRAEDH